MYSFVIVLTDERQSNMEGDVKDLKEKLIGSGKLICFVKGRGILKFLTDHLFKDCFK